MRYFIDTEFIENGPQYPIYLISIGVKCEDGREYYAENENCPLHLANDWVKEHVIPKLHRSNAKSPFMIAAELQRFVGLGEEPVFWGYYADYDWVATAQLYGVMVDLPTSWPKYCLDLKQVQKMLGGGIRLPPDPGEEHHALADARWDLEAWQVLNAEWKKIVGTDLP